MLLPDRCLSDPSSLSSFTSPVHHYFTTNNTVRTYSHICSVGSLTRLILCISSFWHTSSRPLWFRQHCTHVETLSTPTSSLPASLSLFAYCLSHVLFWLSISARLLEPRWLLFSKQRAESSQLTAAAVPLVVSELSVSMQKKTH